VGPFLSLFKLAGACGTNTGFLPGLWDGLCPNGTTPELTTLADVLKLVGNLLRILIAISGGLAIIVIIVASIYYVASTGDPARIKRAKDILTNMAIGLVLIVSAYAIVTYIAKGF
jgi:hypothetical protein